jgi:hypothetical protein
MVLADLIRSLGLTGTAAKVTADLNAKTVRYTDPVPKTAVDIIGLLGAVDAEVVLAGIELAAKESAIGRAIQQSLVSGGLDFSHDVVQAQLSLTASTANMSDEIGEKLLKLGVQQITPYENWAGIGQSVSEAEVATAIIPPVPDSRAVSLGLNIRPDGMSMGFGITEMAGSIALGVIHSIATTEKDNPRLSAAQNQFVSDLLALVTSYGDSIRD